MAYNPASQEMNINPLLLSILVVVTTFVVCIFLPVEIFTFLHIEPERTELTLKGRARQRRAITWLTRPFRRTS